ncbi:MAG: YchF/TatD family DNA exonuclease [Gammaproteobacteria bacterium]|nr:YchF/TatD family DNA exonuclease [Gammaproteobacteria bacterium]
MFDLIDIGANLTHDSFDKDRDEVIARAAAAGVDRMIITGASITGSQDAVKLAAQYSDKFYATSGVHPHHATELDEAGLAVITELAHNKCIVAVGECGLDYFRNFSPREAQLKAFEQQLQIAIDAQKPVFLHQRDAHDDFIALLKNFLPKLHGGVAHCFTGTREQMYEYLDMGFYIGVTGWICDERRGHDLQDAVKTLPLDRVMIETDAPYLMPRDLKQKPDPRRNEPSTLPHILESLASYMNQPAETIAQAATENTERLFKLAAD